MEANVLIELEKRGFLEQVTNRDVLEAELSQRKMTCYIGFDPTASSLHVGSMVPLMSLFHMQRYGHRPIAVLGSGTTMIGDPSGKTELRQMLTREKIVENGHKIKEQISKFVSFENDNGVFVDNADWLLELNYISFLRDIGRHFSVNRMLSAEAYKMRMETGLTFLEFNYQLLQAYDFLVLNRKYNCELQMGGNDQWGNILAGTELIRRADGKDAFAMTFPLLTTSSGQKMGKTASGAVWLDPDRTSPYDFYQYWINVDDKDVVRFLGFFTDLPFDEIAEYSKLEGADIREAKRKLAVEVTGFVHGQDEALKAERAAVSVFTGDSDGDGIPETLISASDLAERSVSQLLADVGLTKSKGEARRLIRNGGFYLNGDRVLDEERFLAESDFSAQGLVFRLGKKRHHRLLLMGD